MNTNVLSGKEFNEKHKGIEFYKLLNEDLTYHGFTYKNGLNIDVNKLNPIEECSKGGLYFNEKNNIPFWIDLDFHFITRVYVPNDANVCIEKNKFKSDKLIVDIYNKFKISEFQLWNDKDFCEMSVLQNACSLKFIKEQTEDLCKMTVFKNWFALKYVKKQTEELCKTAVKQNGYALQFVKEQTNEICYLAIQQDCFALQFVKKQTNEICYFAFKKDCNVYRYVKNKFNFYVYRLFNFFY